MQKLNDFILKFYLRNHVEGARDDSLDLKCDANHIKRSRGPHVPLTTCPEAPPQLFNHKQARVYLRDAVHRSTDWQNARLAPGRHAAGSSWRTIWLWRRPAPIGRSRREELIAR